MALKSTIYKVELSIADIDNNYYAEHALTLARHPSETDERMMVRLVALAFNAWKLQSICNNDGTLMFGAGLSDPDEPDVWLRDFTGRSRVWIEVGQPEERPLSKACGKSDEVLVYCFHHAANVWWKGLQSKVERQSKLQVLNIDSEQGKELAAMAARSMQLQATIQDASLILSSANRNLHIQPVVWKAFGQH
jgi:uncharacterized protein YaeQ